MITEQDFERSKTGSFTSAHYVFHFEPGSFAEKEIRQIAETQENAFSEICETLKLQYPERIHYYFTDSPSQIGMALWGKDFPCNGCAICGRNKIYAVYNQSVQCIGPHEDAHLISFLLNFPHSDFLVEGLAMYFDRIWWGLPNESWASFYLVREPGMYIEQMLDNRVFAGYDCTRSYPVAGAFTGFLIQMHGIAPYLALYRYHGHDYAREFQRIYRLSICQLEAAFRDYLKQFSFHAQTMEEMLIAEGLSRQ